MERKGSWEKKKPTSNELVDDHKDKKKEGLSIKDLSNKIFKKKKIKDLSTLNKTLLGKWY